MSKFPEFDKQETIFNPYNIRICFIGKGRRAFF